MHEYVLVTNTTSCARKAPSLSRSCEVRSITRMALQFNPVALSRLDEGVLRPISHLNYKGPERPGKIGASSRTPRRARFNVDRDYLSWSQTFPSSYRDSDSRVGARANASLELSLCVAAGSQQIQDLEALADSARLQIRHFASPTEEEQVYATEDVFREGPFGVKVYPSSVPSFKPSADLAIQTAEPPAVLKKTHANMAIQTEPEQTRCLPGLLVALKALQGRMHAEVARSPSTPKSENVPASSPLADACFGPAVRDIKAQTLAAQVSSSCHQHGEYGAGVTPSLEASRPNSLNASGRVPLGVVDRNTDATTLFGPRKIRRIVVPVVEGSVPSRNAQITCDFERLRAQGKVGAGKATGVAAGEPRKQGGLEMEMMRGASWEREEGKQSQKLAQENTRRVCTE
ncbi:hypothetical protein B0H16DRAFT_1697892 [Mycena metata]|uniref:Uncharacterized protein n=1 Tax=Mycena metata TaxID=1033252 RepID=A0AAD7HS25_9AGAR|nr:hypothetical protein B0H16DRAFT_1697892 [Mycena metata]